MMSGQNMEYLKLSRRELKERFKAGRMPTEEDFMSLIDSVVNSIDEGFEVNEENGLEIKQKKDNGRLMSFFANLTEHRPQWFMSLRKNTACLSLRTTPTATCATAERICRTSRALTTARPLSMPARSQRSSRRE